MLVYPFVNPLMHWLGKAQNCRSLIIRMFYYTSLNVLPWLVGVAALRRRCLTQNAFEKAEKGRKDSVLL